MLPWYFIIGKRLLDHIGLPGGIRNFRWVPLISQYMHLNSRWHEVGSCNHIIRRVWWGNPLHLTMVSCMNIQFIQGNMRMYFSDVWWASLRPKSPAIECFFSNGFRLSALKFRITYPLKENTGDWGPPFAECRKCFHVMTSLCALWCDFVNRPILPISSWMTSLALGQSYYNPVSMKCPKRIS